MAQRHIQDLANTEKSLVIESDHPNYMILSLKHIVLCHVSGPAGHIEYTTAESLFNGNYATEPPSDLTLDYLI